MLPRPRKPPTTKSPALTRRRSCTNEPEPNDGPRPGPLTSERLQMLSSVHFPTNAARAN